MRSGKNNKRISKLASRVQPGSGNVFADLNIGNPDLALAKAELVERIRALVAERNPTQKEAAELLGLDQPKISALVRGQVTGFSIDRLLRLLNSLGQQVEINVRPVKATGRSKAVRRILVTH